MKKNSIAAFFLLVCLVVTASGFDDRWEQDRRQRDLEMRQQELERRQRDQERRQRQQEWNR